VTAKGNWTIGLGVLCALALAASSARGASAPEPLPGATTAAERSRVEAYWTPQRMADAKEPDFADILGAAATASPPAASSAPPSPFPPASSATRTQTATGSAAADSAVGAQKPPESGVASVAPSGGAAPNIELKQPRVCASSECAVGQAQQVAVGGQPWSAGGSITAATGKVYYTLPSGDYTCSATSVQSNSASLVVTAGHCTFLNGSPARNWVFVPGYDSPVRPYGVWTAQQFYIAPGWTTDQDIAVDYAFVRVNPAADGRRLADVVGALPIGFAAPRGAFTTAIGYPGQTPFYGGRLIYCQGTLVSDTFHASVDEGLACTMAEGSSGGPRLQYFNGSSGVITSVNSFVYLDTPGYLWGPHFDLTTRALYLSAGG
jgi:V8-like Glu-specific endopeptidase